MKKPKPWPTKKKKKIANGGTENVYDPFLALKEAAAFIRVSIRTLSRYEHDGLITARRLPDGRRRYRRSDLLKLLSEEWIPRPDKILLAANARAAIRRSRRSIEEGSV